MVQDLPRDPLSRHSGSDVAAQLGALDTHIQTVSTQAAQQVSDMRALLDTLADALSGETQNAAREMAEQLDLLAGRLQLSAVPLEETAYGIRRTLESLTALVREAELKVRNMTTLNTIALMLGRETNVDRLLEAIMDTVIAVAHAERGLLVLVDETGRMDYRVARAIDRLELDEPAFQSSRSIIRNVVQTRQAERITSALSDERFAMAESVQRLRLQSVVCVPLATEQSLVGVLYLDNSTVSGMFTEMDVALLNELGKIIATGIEKALEFRQMERRQEELDRQLRGRFRFDRIIGTAPSFVRVLKLTADVADTDATVLIQGENGTGKELIAQAVHSNSRRVGKNIVVMNCAAIPENLLESELFGHVKGAFTGATESKAGKFEAADGGTLFMDEIGEMAMSLQAKMLRVLQEREIERVGSNRPLRVDVRIIAATNRDLRQMVKDGKFREDLFHRLNVINIVMPSLRERVEDILPLAEHFLASEAKAMQRPLTKFSDTAVRALMAYGWPGNIRELENVVKRAAILTRDPIVGDEHFPDYVRQGTGEAVGSIPLTSDDLLDAKRVAREEAYERVERPFVEAALRRSGGQVSRAAADVGMNRVQFHGLLKKYDIEAREFKERRRGDGRRSPVPA